MANTRSLLWQPSLLDAGEESRFDAQFASVRRVELDETAWVEHVPGWVHGADALFATIVERAPWTQRRVHMYDRMVDEPRLIAWYGVALDDLSLPPVIAPMAAALSARYGREFDGVGAALYRDGRDSVAWHADRIPADIVEPVVALISLGSPRALRMRRKKTTAERPEGSGARSRPIDKTTAERPEGSGARSRPMDTAPGRARQRDARSFTLVPGDLFVMGGMSQRTWEHSVPKVASAGPRLSLQFRHSR
jgi:alkylated DNA repair dioxygenase AlkB